MMFEVGQHVVHQGADWTVMYVSFVEPAVLCKRGHPPEWGGQTNWFYTDELSAA
jgi:hypothetical protein